MDATARGAAARTTHWKRELRITEMVIIGVVTVALVSVDLMFYFWPFRYREVHPLLEQVFQSRVDVKSYHRTYFPHPGFVAEGVTFYRHGDTHIPPLATVAKMTVAGQWLRLIFHPHTLYQIRLEGLHVQIPPPGTKARGMDLDNGVISTSDSKLRILTILADGAGFSAARRSAAALCFCEAGRTQRGGQTSARLHCAGDDFGTEGNGSGDGGAGAVSDEQLWDNGNVGIIFADGCGFERARWDVGPC
jgi:hypothetical protein